MPGIVATSMSGTDKSRGVPSPEDYCQSAVATFGLKQKTNGHIYHAIMVSIIILFKIESNIIMCYFCITLHR